MPYFEAITAASSTTMFNLAGVCHFIFLFQSDTQWWICLQKDKTIFCGGPLEIKILFQLISLAFTPISFNLKQIESNKRSCVPYFEAITAASSTAIFNLAVVCHFIFMFQSDTQWFICLQKCKTIFSGAPKKKKFCFN